jgi:hypothetical protein
MPSRNLVRAFIALWWVLGTMLLAYSVRTAWHALAASGNAANLHVAILGSLEAVAALLFLVPRTMRLGGAALLVVFALAFVLHAARGEFGSQLLLYAAAVTFVMAHGRVPLAMVTGRPQKQHASGSGHASV